jgi:hypothetical protein
MYCSDVVPFLLLLRFVRAPSPARECSHVRGRCTFSRMFIRARLATRNIKLENPVKGAADELELI